MTYRRIWLSIPPIIFETEAAITRSGSSIAERGCTEGDKGTAGLPEGKTGPGKAKLKEERKDRNLDDTPGGLTLANGMILPDTGYPSRAGRTTDLETLRSTGPVQILVPAAGLGPKWDFCTIWDGMVVATEACYRRSGLHSALLGGPPPFRFVILCASSLPSPSSSLPHPHPAAFSGPGGTL